MSSRAILPPMRVLKCGVMPYSAGMTQSASCFASGNTCGPCLVCDQKRALGTSGIAKQSAALLRGAYVAGPGLSGIQAWILTKRTRSCMSCSSSRWQRLLAVQHAIVEIDESSNLSALTHIAAESHR